MKKIITMLFVVFSVSSYADVYWGVGYGNISDEDDGDELSLGALELTVGNRVNEKFAFEFTLAQGIQDDTVDGIEAELDTSFYAKGMYYINENIFVNAFWGRVELEGCYQGTCASAGDTEGGFGIGVDFPLQSDAAIRLSYDSVDDADIVSLKYIF
mgnify:CR=1 FL=1